MRFINPPQPIPLGLKQYQIGIFYETIIPRLGVYSGIGFKPASLQVYERLLLNPPINYDKPQEVTQDRDESLSAFLSHLTEATLRYTNQDPETLEGRQLLMTYYFSQSYPVIKAKLRQLDRGTLTP